MGKPKANNRKVIDFIRKQLLGPANGPEEIIQEAPIWKYPCGLLFPQETPPTSLEEGADSDISLEGHDLDEKMLEHATSFKLPSSMGISFLISRQTQELVCILKAANYSRNPNKTNNKNSTGSWQRSEIFPNGSHKIILQVPQTTKEDEHLLADGKIKFLAKYRSHRTNWLVTVTMINNIDRNDANNKHFEIIEDVLFQSHFSITTQGGKILSYPESTVPAQSYEDRALALAYQHCKTYGIGHGCAAKWPEKEIVDTIEAEPLPEIEVPSLTNMIEVSELAKPALSLQWLANPKTTQSELRKALNAFVIDYESWIIDQKSKAETLSSEHKVTGKEIIEHQQIALHRLQQGINYLLSSKNEKIWQSFKLAQQAMLLQFIWSKQNKIPVDFGNGKTEPIDVWANKYQSSYRWRPFQLAFQLLVIESLANEKSTDRDVLDLLWFPTGGGKTEAYLALMAFEIIHRRLNNTNHLGSGTVVLMRYTLRLLTTQQFERCATLISVLETMRTKQPEMFGQDPITLGLWVGSSVTPNNLDSYGEDNAKKMFDKLLAEDNPINPFQLICCPCCGTRIVPQHKTNRRANYGLQVTESEFKIYCPDPKCQLHDRIPVLVVDEDIYNNPPTVLLGTIDKFATMVRKPQASVLLGWRNDKNVMPPSLVIQDELHLITGPLGTIAGVYEAALDTLLGLDGNKAKYIASTATINQAEAQCQALYARQANVFPPIGLNARDSYFCHEEKNKKGRLFLGMMGNSIYTNIAALAHVSAACAASVHVLGENIQDQLDNYWTQIIFHNTKRDLGRTSIGIQDDILSKLRNIEEQLGIEKKFRRKLANNEELSANLRGDELKDILKQLEISRPKNATLDIVPCTNMFSVGVDVQRLGLMIFRGQPIRVSEYIQSSSRVGRDPDKMPGIIITQYSYFRIRDRSHYETFQSFHSSLYRQVEPASVTPFAEPALERTLHAAIVMVCRTVNKWYSEDEARKFLPFEQPTDYALEELLKRLQKACTNEKEQMLVKSKFKQRIEQWQGYTEQNLHFVGYRNFTCLLGEFDADDHGIWPTLHSMRHVDNETPIMVWGSDK